MASGLKEIFLICRLCLSRDEAHLIPIAEVFDATFTIDDMRSFTGVHIDGPDADQRVLHAICLKCTSKLKMFAAFRTSCIGNDYQFNQLWWRCCVNISCNDSVHATEYLYDSDTDPLEVEYLVEEDPNSDLAAFDDSTLIQQTCGFDTKETEEIPLEDAAMNNFNSSDIESSSLFSPLNHENESPLSEQTSGEIHQQSVTTNTPKNHVLEDEMLYSANYIELGEPHSDNDEPDAFQNGMEWTNNSYLNKIRSLQRSAGTSQKSGTRSILFSRKNQKRVKPLCEVCGKLVTKFTTHIASHTEELNHTCPHCPVKMKHPSYIIRHIQSVHFNMVVKSCAACNIDFKYFATYRSHMYTKHGVGKPHECVVCSRRFHAACRMRKHVQRFHSTDEHDCDVCGRKFKLREQMKRHQKKVHTKGQPYKCSQCPKRFKCTSYRNKHERMHRSDVVIECPLCDKSFCYKYQINAHIRKMHPAASNSETETPQQETTACSETSGTELMESN